MIFYIFSFPDLLRESDSSILRLHVSSCCFQIVVAMLPLLDDLIFHENVAGTLRAMLACPTDGQVGKEARQP